MNSVECAEFIVNQCENLTSYINENKEDLTAYILTNLFSVVQRNTFNKIKVAISNIIETETHKTSLFSKVIASVWLKTLEPKLIVDTNVINNGINVNKCRFNIIIRSTVYHEIKSSFMRLLNAARGIDSDSLFSAVTLIAILIAWSFGSGVLPNNTNAPFTCIWGPQTSPHNCRLRLSGKEAKDLLFELLKPVESVELSNKTQLKCLDVYRWNKSRTWPQIKCKPHKKPSDEPSSSAATMPTPVVQQKGRSLFDMSDEEDENNPNGNPFCVNKTKHKNEQISNPFDDVKTVVQPKLTHTTSFMYTPRNNSSSRFIYGEKKTIITKPEQIAAPSKPEHTETKHVEFNDAFDLTFDDEEDEENNNLYMTCLNEINRIIEERDRYAATLKTIKSNIVTQLNIVSTLFAGDEMHYLPAFDEPVSELSRLYAEMMQIDAKCKDTKRAIFEIVKRSGYVVTNAGISVTEFKTWLETKARK